MASTNPTTTTNNSNNDEVATTANTTSTTPTTTQTLAARFRAATNDVTDPVERVRMLCELHTATAALFSKNESLDDVASNHIIYLGLEHLIAEAYTQLPMTAPTSSEETAAAAPHSEETTKRRSLTDRLRHLQTACMYWQAFLERLDRLELLNKEEQAMLQHLMEYTDHSVGNVTSADDTSDARLLSMLPQISRNEKIARYRAVKAAQDEKQRLQSLQERRRRLNLQQDDTVDGFDDDSLERTLNTTIVVQLYKLQAVEGWMETLREMVLLQGMLSQQQQPIDARYQQQQQQSSSSNNNTGLQVTHITQNPVTGQLHMDRQEIRANVLRPGWNQPTMSLEEFAEREVHQAMARDAAQKEQEAAERQNPTPRRYEYIKRDGLEDNADLVDASAPLDRAWDDFKDENPRGSGNKRGDVGDRNF